MPTTTNTQTRDRAWRRAQRARVVTARAERIRALFPSRPIVQGQLARHSGLGCANGRRCLLCHDARREPSRQELLADGPCAT